MDKEMQAIQGGSLVSLAINDETINIIIILVLKVKFWVKDGNQYYNLKYDSLLQP